MCFGCSELRSFFNNQRSHWATEMQKGMASLCSTQTSKILGLKIDSVQKDIDETVLSNLSSFPSTNFFLSYLILILIKFFFPLCGLKKKSRGKKKGFERTLPLWRRFLYHRNVYTLHVKTIVTVYLKYSSTLLIFL